MVCPIFNFYLENRKNMNLIFTLSNYSHWINILCNVFCIEEISANYIVVTNIKNENIHPFLFFFNSKNSYFTCKMPQNLYVCKYFKSLCAFANYLNCVKKSGTERTMLEILVFEKAWWRWAHNKTDCKSEQTISSLNLLCVHLLERTQ